MKYGIVENNKFVLLDNDLGRVQNTIMFMPQYTLADIVTFEDDAVEQAYDGSWYIKGFTPAIPDDVKRDMIKSEKETTIKSMTVMVDKMVFECDEKSQERISRNILAAIANDLPLTTKIDWKLADNTIKKVSIQQLAKVILQATNQQTDIVTHK